MDFYYELINTGKVDPDKLAQAEDALEKGLFICQQEFEKALKMFHEIHFDSADASGAIVVKIEIEDNGCEVVLDCEKIES